MRSGISLITLLLALTLLCVPSRAQEDANADLDAELEALLAGDEEVSLYQFPKIAPEFRLSVGYRGVTQDGEESAARYECLECSYTFGIEARSFSYPHRFYFVFDSLSRKDYFGELRYAWGSGVFLHTLHRSLFHNLEHATLLDLDTLTADPGVDLRDRNKDYGVQTSLNTAFVRLKYPDFPAHAFVSAWDYTREGTEQQRNLLGSGWHNDIVRASQERDVKMDTQVVEVGVNSHLARIEAEYVHREKSFTPAGDDTMKDTYTSAGTFRAAGEYLHDVIPETKGSSDTLKFHTSLTGKWVASATLIAKERENLDGGATSESFIGTAAVRWMPRTNISVNVRYLHGDHKVDTPSTVRVKDSTGTNIYQFDVRDAMATKRDKVTLVLRYRPVNKLSLKGTYAYERVARDNADDWSIQDETKKTTVSLGAAARLPGRVKAEADYEHVHMDGPAYNIEPDNSDSGAVSLTWNPSGGVHLFTSYDKFIEKRRYLQYSDSNDAEDRTHSHSRFMAGGTFVGPEGMTVSVNYARLENYIEQDMVVYEGALATVDEGVVYEDNSDSFSFALDYTYKSKVVLHGEVTHTRCNGEYDAGGTLGATEDYASMDYEENAFGASAEVALGGGAEAGVDFRQIERYDAEDNPHDKIEDGNVRIVMLKLTKKW